MREAKLLAAEAVRHAIETVDYTSDPPLNIPEKYKNLIWFALPIDIALMMIKQNETGLEQNCDASSIPFLPDDAKVRSTSERSPPNVPLSFQTKVSNSSKVKPTINVRDVSVAALNRKRPTLNLSLSTPRMRS